MQVDNAAVLRLRVVAEADPGVLVRTLQFFQARNIVPGRVSAQRMGAEFLEIAIEVDATECSKETFRMVVSKLQELPIIIAATAVCD